ncbi:DUF1573 domain-containing protein [bacterium]|nr:DUF1573 domain-containing protein [bacterium]RQV93746.1 MAG: DUF1573 domain-containing protein [bacterium]
MKKFTFLLSLFLLYSEIGLAQHLQYLTPQVIDFGSVKEDTLLQGSILITNSGSDPVTIRNVRTSCGCTVAQALKKECAPGDTVNIAFSFNTKGFDGLVRKSVTVFFQESDIEDAHFVIQTHVVQDIDIDPRHFHFAVNQFNSDSVVTELLTIRNHLKKPLHIHNIYAVDDMITVVPTAAVIQPGEAKSLEIQFNVYQMQQRYMTLTIETDYNQEPEIVVPIIIDKKN